MSKDEQQREDRGSAVMVRRRGRVACPAPAHKCERCGCTNHDACVSETHGPCYWFNRAETLCSACALGWDDCGKRDSQVIAEMEEAQ